ncbi:MAG: hypothetical protein Q9190_007268 [Brigantiaea leucoxantha]
MSAPGEELASTDVKWYIPDSALDAVPAAAKALLETYSHIPPQEVLSHVIDIRQKAWQIHRYPCIGQFRFLDLSISLTPAYPKILERLKNENAKLLDMGTCFGQDIRKLVADGAPAESLYGADLRGDFWELGYDLFRDRDALRAGFIQGDIFDNDREKGNFTELEGRLDIIHAASFLHLFDRDSQKRICKRFVELLRPRAGSVILGRQAGNENANHYPHRTTERGIVWRHNAESWREMWEEVGSETGTRWNVQGGIVARDDVEKSFFQGLEDWRRPGEGLFRFEVRRL